MVDVNVNVEGTSGRGEVEPPGRKSPAQMPQGLALAQWLRVATFDRHACLRGQGGYVGGRKRGKYVSDTDGKTAGDQAAEGASVPPGSAAAEAAGAGEPSSASPELDKALADAAKYKDQLLRTAADFDNFRKRTRRDVEEAQRKGLERALIELLPVSDNLERAVQAAQGTSDVAAIVDGVRMVLRFFEDALNRLGVERVPSVGGGFDPALHEAVQHVPSDAAPGTVVSEMVPGYRLGGKLLRAAVVAVAAPRAASEPSAGDGSGEGMAEPPQN